MCVLFLSVPLPHTTGKFEEKGIRLYDVWLVFVALPGTALCDKRLVQNKRVYFSRVSCSLLYDDAAYLSAALQALRENLLKTGSKTIVEAASNDRVWGIGISVKQAQRGAKWRGENLLGEALMQVRDELRAADANI